MNGCFQAPPCVAVGWPSEHRSCRPPEARQKEGEGRTAGARPPRQDPDRWQRGWLCRTGGVQPACLWPSRTGPRLLAPPVFSPSRPALTPGLTWAAPASSTVLPGHPSPTRGSSASQRKKKRQRWHQGNARQGLGRLEFTPRDAPLPLSLACQASGSRLFRAMESSAQKGGVGGFRKTIFRCTEKRRGKHGETPPALPAPHTHSLCRHRRPPPEWGICHNSALRNPVFL